MKVLDFVSRAEAQAVQLRIENRKDEARRLLAHKAGFRAVCDFLGKDINTMTLDQFMALTSNARLKSDKRLRSRYNSAAYMVRKYAGELADPPSTSIPTILDVVKKVDRLRPLFTRSRYRNRAYKTVTRTLDEAGAELRRRLHLFEELGEDASGWTISQLQARAGSRKGLAKVKRAVGLLSGEADDAGMPVLGGTPKVDKPEPPPKPQPKPEAAKAAPPQVVESGPAPPKVEKAPAHLPVPPSEIRPPAQGLTDLPYYDESLSLEDNYRRLHRTCVEVASGQQKALKKVDGLVEVIKQLSDLVR